MRDNLFVNIDKILENLSQNNIKRVKKIVSNIQNYLKSENLDLLNGLNENNNIYLTDINQKESERNQKAGMDIIESNQIKQEIKHVKAYLISLQNNYSTLYKNNVKFKNNVRKILTESDLNLTSEQKIMNLELLKSDRDSRNEQINAYQENESQVLKRKIDLILMKVTREDKKSEIVKIKDREDYIFKLLESLYEAKTHILESFDKCIEQCKTNLKIVHRSSDTKRDINNQGDMINNDQINQLKEDICQIANEFILKIQNRINEKEILEQKEDNKSQSTKKEIKMNNKSVIIPLIKVKKKDCDAEEDQYIIKDKIINDREETETIIIQDNPKNKKKPIKKSTKISNKSKNIKKKVKRKPRKKRETTKVTKKRNKRKEERAVSLMNDEPQENNSVNELCTRRSVYSRSNYSKPINTSLT